MPITPAVSGVDSPAGWRERDAELVAPCYSRYTDLVVDSARGVVLHTVDGREVLDFGCGIGVTGLGHCHPAVVEAVHAQVDRLWHTSVTTFHPALVQAAETLTSITPHGLDQVFFASSGAEVVEAAIKLARKATGRSEIIAFNGGFHGRTYGAVTLTSSKAKYHAGVGPLLPGVHHVRFPDHIRECTHAEGAPCPISQGHDIEELFRTRVPAESVAAIVVEPLLGEGGYVIPPKDFLPTLRRICDEHGILLIADEVQSGMGRTGRWFAVDHVGVVPDLMTIAKALGNGLPVAALAGSRAVMSAWHPGDHGTTYGGNPIACAAAVAVIKTIERDGLLDRATVLGARAVDRIRGWQAWCPSIREVRGLGLWIGIEFREPDGSPRADLVTAVRRLAVDRGLVLLSCGIDDNVIRLIPPLTITDDELERGLGIFEDALRGAG